MWTHFPLERSDSKVPKIKEKHKKQMQTTMQKFSLNKPNHLHGFRSWKLAAFLCDT